MKTTQTYSVDVEGPEAFDFRHRKEFDELTEAATYARGLTLKGDEHVTIAIIEGKGVQDRLEVWEC